MARASQKRKRAVRSTTFHKAIDTPDGSRHVVGIGSLRVIVLKQDDFWFARGLDIDYAAQGRTEAEVKRNFEKGLKLTIKAHLKEFGHIGNLLSTTPPEAWKKLVWSPVMAKQFDHSQVSVHKLSSHVQEVLKFDAIRFIRPELVAA
jgi:hypothetical protein